MKTLNFMTMKKEKEKKEKQHYLTQKFVARLDEILAGLTGEDLPQNVVAYVMA